VLRKEGPKAKRRTLRGPESQDVCNMQGGLESQEVCNTQAREPRGVCYASLLSALAVLPFGDGLEEERAPWMSTSWK
jgi:hypothetical protein